MDAFVQTSKSTGYIPNCPKPTRYDTFDVEKDEMDKFFKNFRQNDCSFVIGIIALESPKIRTSLDSGLSEGGTTDQSSKLFDDITLFGLRHGFFDNLKILFNYKPF